MFNLRYAFQLNMTFLVRVMGSYDMFKCCKLTAFEFACSNPHKVTVGQIRTLMPIAALFTPGALFSYNPKPRKTHVSADRSQLID